MRRAEISNRDLILERVVDATPERVWRAWTQPEQLKQWFTPRPWTTPECEIDLRPGGVFRTVMRSPEGQLQEHVACYLEVVPNERLTWTVALEPGFRPNASRTTGDVPTFTAVITMEPSGNGTKYRAVAMHDDAAGAAKHEEMGFHDGWGAALDQLVALLRARS